MVCEKLLRKSHYFVSLPSTANTFSVIHAYSASLRLSFVFAAATAALGLLLVLFIRLPRLTRKIELPAEE